MPSALSDLGWNSKVLNGFKPSTRLIAILSNSLYLRFQAG